MGRVYAAAVEERRQPKRVLLLQYTIINGDVIGGVIAI